MKEPKCCIVCGKDGVRKDRKCCSVECGRLSKMKDRPNCLTCGEKCKTTTAKYCSRACAHKAKEGKKQSKEIIERRIANTDHEKKEAKRRKTMIERYGVENSSQIPSAKEKISKAHAGAKRPRSEAHQQNIIESKRKNGTLKHSEDTKSKISESLTNKFADPDFDRSVFVNKGTNGKNSVTGYYKDTYFRSSYEEMFLKFCDKYSIRVETAANKSHCVKYLSTDGTIRSYFPDFYLPEYETTVEIKPVSMLEIGENQNKILASVEKVCNYVVLTEMDGFLYEDEWDEFYNCQVKYWK